MENVRNIRIYSGAYRLKASMSLRMRISDNPKITSSACDDEAFHSMPVSLLARI
jgi:hypothetical protein